MKVDIYINKFRYDTFQKGNNQGTDQFVQMRRLVFAFVVRLPSRTFSHVKVHMVFSLPYTCSSYDIVDIIMAQFV